MELIEKDTELAQGTAIASPKGMLDALKTVIDVVERRNTIPILGTVKVIFGETCTITATDLDMEVIAYFEGRGDLTFCMCPRNLTRILKATPKPVEFSKPDAELIIKAGDLQVSYNDIYEQEDMPFFPHWPKGTNPFLQIEADDFVRAMNGVKHCISDEETRYYLNGIYLEKNEHFLNMVATNGHVLGKYNLPMQDENYTFTNAILPRKSVLWLVKNLKGQGQFQISQRPDGLALSFKTEKWVMRSKMIDGTFPDYTRVIPKPCTNIKLTLSGDALKRLDVLRSDNRSVAVKMDGDGKAMSIRIPDMATATVPLSDTCKGPAIGFDLRYLRNICPPGEAVRIEGNGSGDAVTITGADINLIYVLMPMRF